MTDIEERAVSRTGGEKGTKLERFELIPPEFETALARHLGIGAHKYADRNWQRGYPWSLSYAALRRHLAAFWNGEDNDPETDEPHIIAAAWHCMALHYFGLYFADFDDRFDPYDLPEPVHEDVDVDLNEIDWSGL